jgi:hypothetical protein
MAAESYGFPERVRARDLAVLGLAIGNARLFSDFAPG